MTRRLLPLICLTAMVLLERTAAAEVVPTETGRQAFLEALKERDAAYDPVERMLRAPFSSPGYHTTLTGGSVHRTRDSLVYAVALLDAGQSDRRERAEAILRRVISLQDQDPNSRTYGIWPWFLEEPLERMSPPDWNWADFCGTQLLQVAIDHMSRLPDDLQRQVKESILHAARSIVRRDVGPGYTNIALMGAYTRPTSTAVGSRSRLAAMPTPLASTWSSTRARRAISTSPRSTRPGSPSRSRWASSASFARPIRLST